ncbi:universal stress protein [Halorubrum halophilum]|uniref:universal stress protein n=1 Tax=Halorubrum halophilum TaxID=413816 RepID=UPI00186B3B38|nr:universal stress protein [Halorubrum halophilum]
MNGSEAGEGGGGATEPGIDGAPSEDAPQVGEPIVDATVAAAVESTATATDASLERADRASRPDRVSSILVAVAPGPHSGATVDVARAIADATEAWLELFHVVPSDAALADGPPGTAGGEAAHSDDTPQTEGDQADYVATGEGMLDAARDRLGSFDRVDRWLVEDRSAAGAIVEQSPYYDLVVIGAPTTGTVGRFVFGSTADTVIDDAAVPVVVVEGDGSAALEGS